jgi:hypothetical protein
MWVENEGIVDQRERAISLVSIATGRIEIASLGDVHTRACFRIRERDSRNACRATQLMTLPVARCPCPLLLLRL